MIPVTILALSRRANVKCFKLNIQGLKNITLVARLDISVHEGTPTPTSVWDISVRLIDNC